MIEMKDDRRRDGTNARLIQNKQNDQFQRWDPYYNNGKRIG